MEKNGGQSGLSEKEEVKNQTDGKDKTIHNIAEADFALQEAMEDAGMEAETYGIWGFFWRLRQRFPAREKQLVKKKKYIWLTVLTGWFGGHRFYTKRYFLGAVYLVFFWTLIPVMMSFIDLMEVIPIKADEDGCVLM